MSTKFMIERVSENLVIAHYYNAQKDCYEKLHEAPKAYTNEDLLVIGNRFYYEHQGKLYEMICDAERKVLLKSPFCAQSLFVLRPKDEYAPFNFLLVQGYDGEQASYFEALPALSYEKWLGAITAISADGQKVRYSYHYEYDNQSRIEYAYLVRH